MDDIRAEAFKALTGIGGNLNAVILDQVHTVRLLLSAFAAGGHVLLEDYPGTGKTMLARAFSRSMDAEFRRIQFTPDLLPSDISGVSVLDPGGREFRFRKGPVFTNILLADEINRASPRTQSALLECMGERQVTIDERTYQLSDPFFVIATQNPVEFRGTYPLPEALLDRFMMKLTPGYVSVDTEASVRKAQMERHPIEDVKPCLTISDLGKIREAVRTVHVSDEICRYIVTLMQETRKRPDVKMGAGPRASIAMMEACRALAVLDGSAHVTPEHIRELAIPLMAHRIMLDPQAMFSGLTGATVVRDVLKSVACPA